MKNEKYVYYMFKTKWLFWKLLNIGYKTGICPTLPIWILPLGKKEKKLFSKVLYSRNWINRGKNHRATATAKSLQSCPTLCDPIDGSPPGSPVPGILQARTLEWAVISFSNAWKWKMNVKSLSRVRLFVTPWTATYQAHPIMGFSRQEYWSGLPLPSPGYS